MIAPAEPLITLTGVVAGYGGKPILRGIDLELAADQFSAVVGPSGSGKTTLLRVLLGTVKPSGGSVRRLPRLTVSYVPQLETVNWNFPVTVFECVLMGRSSGRLAPWPSRGERAEVAVLLDRLGIGDLARRHIRELSGGQQQRMFLARALLRRPRLILLDEPTSGVDVTTRHDILHLLADIHADGVAILLTTHDLNGLAAHLPHVMCLRQRVIAAGDPRSVITPQVMAETYGTGLQVLEHLGMPIVVDDRSALLQRTAGDPA